jgi:geranylgeranyl diphosphate synthase type II
MSIAKYHQLYSEFLSQNAFVGEPNNLYEPMKYIMELGGKRIRPILCLVGTEACGGKVENALPVAHAMEVFHNFSLVHDDIMDRADQRRGLPTVHKKWNEPTAILAGDNLLVKAYESILTYSGNGKDEILTLFSKTATEVCEGQQDDMDFADRYEVSEAHYLNMIQKKTAVVVGDFAIAIGMSFQMMDDYLDAFGSSESIGKVSGGDIMEGKKTWLYIKSCELSSETTSWFSQYSAEERVSFVQNQWRAMGLDQMLLNVANDYNDQGLSILKDLEEMGVSVNGLREILEFLQVRTH